MTYVPGNKPELFFYDEQGTQVEPYPNVTLLMMWWLQTRLGPRLTPFSRGGVLGKTDKIPIRSWSRERIVDKLAEKGFPVPPPLGAAHTDSAANSDL